MKALFWVLIFNATIINNAYGSSLICHNADHSVKLEVNRSDGGMCICTTKTLLLNGVLHESGNQDPVFNRENQEHPVILTEDISAAEQFIISQFQEGKPGEDGFLVTVYYTYMKVWVDSLDFFGAREKFSGVMECTSREYNGMPIP